MTKIISNAQKLGIIIIINSLIGLSFSYILSDVFGVIIPTILIIIAFVFRNSRLLSYFTEFIFPALAIWMSFFIFVYFNTAYKDVKVFFWGSLTMLICSLLFGLWGIVGFGSTLIDRD